MAAAPHRLRRGQHGHDDLDLVPGFLGWLAKSLILRYGGVKMYREALPFFIGLVLGDYAISSLWALYFLATGHAGYRTFPI